MNRTDPVKENDMTTADPARIVTTLVDAGWDVAGSKKGVYVRLRWPHDKRSTLTVPLDPTYSDYDDLLSGVIQALEDAIAVGQDAAKALTAYQPDQYA